MTLKLPKEEQSPSSRKLATILAALRYWQREGLLSGGHEQDIATNGDEVDPLTADEIDDLCEGLNVKGVLVTITEEDREAIGFAFDLAHDDQSNYMTSNNMAQDYGADWPETRAMKDDSFRRLGAIGERIGLYGEVERWNALADSMPPVGDPAPTVQPTASTIPYSQSFGRGWLRGIGITMTIRGKTVLTMEGLHLALSMAGYTLATVSATKDRVECSATKGERVETASVDYSTLTSNLPRIPLMKARCVRALFDKIKQDDADLIRILGEVR